ncbi:MAG: hypothetical protein AMXMBFR64_08570 [Myxococcales bacterium]
MPLSPRTRGRLLWSVIVLGAVYRAWGFWEPSLWVDEFVTEWILRGATLGEVTERARYAYMPPLYFWICKPFVEVLGISALSVRLPAVIFGTLGLVTLHRLVRLTCGARIAFAAVAIAAAHPEALWYSQEARVYSFGMMVAPLAIEAAWTASLTGRRGPLVRYVLSSAALLWAHHLFAPIIAALAAWLLWRSRTGGLVAPRRWLAAHAAIAALCALPAWWALSTVAAGRIPEATRGPATLESLAAGWRLPELAVLLLLGALAGVVATRLPPGRSLEPPSPPVAAAGLFALLLLAVPAAQTALGVALDRPFYMVRYRMPVAMLIAPLLAWLVLAVLPLRRPAVAMGTIAVLLHLVFPVRMLLTSGQASYHQADTRWDDVLARVESEWRPGTVVLFQNPLQEWVLVDERVDPALEGLLLSPLHSHYVRAPMDRSFALPPRGERLSRVVDARLAATDPDRVIVVAWTPDAQPPPVPSHPGWTRRSEQIWNATVTVAERQELATAPQSKHHQGLAVR